MLQARLQGGLVIQAGNEREKGCKTGSAHDSSRDLAARPSACSNVDYFIVQILQSHKSRHLFCEMSNVCF